MKYLKISEPFDLECGETLPGIELAYTTYGQLNDEQDNVVWICHALTANADPMEWWPGLVGEGRIFDPERHFIVCANMLGSCYGSTGPQSVNPATGKPYHRDFPPVTIRDIVRAQQHLQRHLGIERIKLIIGGSMGGQQALEWSIIDPGLFDRVCILASNARHSPWGIAFNEAQRMAIEADQTLHDGSPGAGQRGLEAARAIAMLSYRNYHTYLQTQSEENSNKIGDFRASSYQRYQGLKLRKRFDVFAYLTLSRAMDSHNVARGRENTEAALQQIKAPTLVVSIESDVLFPVEEQVEIVNYVPHARLEIIDSLYGHDGFLIEYDKIGRLVANFMDDPGFQAGSSGYKLRNGQQNGRRHVKKRSALPGTERF